MSKISKSIVISEFLWLLFFAVVFLMTWISRIYHGFR